MRRTWAVFAAVCLVIGLVPSNVAAGNSQYFPETGQTSSNAFYEFWQTHGGLEILGMPVSPAYERKDSRIIQIYERALMEWHPENTRENRVQIERLGDVWLIASEDENKTTTIRTRRHAPPRGCAATSDCETSSVTNHTVLGAFRDYWYANGGIASFGLPLTEEFPICESIASPCPRAYSAQIFERNIFEWHPEVNGGAVLLRRLGAIAWDNIDKTNIPKYLRTVPDYDGVSAPPSAPAPPAPPASVYTPPAPVYTPSLPPISAPPPPPAPVYNPPPPVSSGAVSGSGYSCPSGYPIKGNLTTYNGEKIYHVPGGQFYDSTKPEQCFATEADARAAGYRASLR